MSLSDNIVPRLLPFIDHSIKKHGKDSFLWVGSAPWINIMEPGLIREAFTKILDFKKPPPNPLVKLLGTGLATYEGDRWAKHQRLINPAFHVEKLKNMLPAFYLSCSQMPSKWEKLVSDEGSCELDVWPELQSMMRDVISRTSFGSSYEEGKRIFELQKELADIAIQVIYTYKDEQDYKRMKKLDKEIQEALQTIISKKEMAMKGWQRRLTRDIGGIEFQRIEQNKNDRKAGLTMKEVIEECKTVLLCWTGDNFESTRVADHLVEHSPRLASSSKRRGSTSPGRKKTRLGRIEPPKNCK